MATKQEKIDALLKEMKLTLDTPSKEEFIAFAKQIVDIVQKLRQENKATSESLEKAFTQSTKSLGDNNEVSLVSVKSEIKKALDKSFKEQSSTMNLLRDKIRNLKDGKDADEESMIERLKALIPEMPEIPKMPDLERFDEQDERLSGKIEEQQKEIDELKKRPIGRLGGGHTDIGIVATLGRRVLTDTPNGLVNGSNKVYTVTSTINVVLGFAINGGNIHTGDYSVSGNTITFTTALIASLSGKDFEMIYI